MIVRLDRDRLISTLVELCEIKSPSGHEEKLARYIRDQLRDLNLPVEQDAVGNLYTRCYSKHSDSMFLSCHMDTVPVDDEAEITVVRRDGTIRSDGTTILGGDDKQGVAAALEMLRLCRENPESHRSLDVIFTVQEEQGSRGGAAVDTGRLQARTGFNLDGETRPGTVIHKAPRKGQFHCRVEGKSSHAALDPEGGINAIVLASRIIAALPLGVPGPESTSNVGKISGGSQTNVVPDNAEFFGELRSFSETEYQQLETKIDRICRELAEEQGGRAVLSWNPTYPAYEVSTDAPCSLWFKEACLQMGIEPDFVSSRGGGDSNQLNGKGLENLVFGLGMHSIHSVDEYLIEDEYCRGVEILTRILFPEN